ncbi:MAG: hypothetical protein ACM3UR_13145 [Bacteroidota bacterium]|jgi:hypothetical protein|nr:hypothetical protein [Ignavibacteria bacterium]MCU7525984.1 hypothetical protein [Ignavibacteria bacterium]
MFEKEINFIYDFSINEVRRLGSFFTYEELASADLHPAIIKYISAELDYLIYEDRQRLLSNSNFDYSGSKIAEYFSLIGEEIKRSKRFSFEYVDDLILHAISFNVNYLAQPKWALTKLIFEKEDVIKTSELKQIINYVYFHEYIKAIIEKYLLKKNLQMISRAEFETIIDKLDQEILGTDPSRVFNLVLRAIGEFFNIGSVIKSRIPLYPFKLYLKEKKFQGHVAKLDSSFKGDTRQLFDIVEVQNVLFPQEVKKQPEKKPQTQKPAFPKAAEENPRERKTEAVKSEDVKPAEPKPAEVKPEGPKPLVPNFRPNGGNYLERILKQETPASFFSSEEDAPESGAPEKEEESPAIKEEPIELFEVPAEEEPSIPDITENSEDKVEDKAPEESVVMEFPEEEKTPFELEFEEVKEPETEASAPAPEVQEEEKPEEIFEGIDIDKIDLDTIDSDEAEDKADTSREGGSQGFLSKFLKKGARKSDKPAVDDIAEEISEPVINFDAEISIEEEKAPLEIKEAEDAAMDEAPQSGKTFSRIFTVISEVFSKREQQKIISELFANKPEKFAGTVYNVITEARDVYDAERLIDSVLKANKIDLSSRWAKVFKKNIKQYFNQD